jgi:hypothetical protein
MEVKYRWKKIVCRIAVGWVSHGFTEKAERRGSAWWGWSGPKLLRKSRKTDRTQRTFDDILHTRKVRKDFQVVLWPSSWFHADICVLATGIVAVERPRCAPRGVFAQGAVLLHDDGGRVRTEGRQLVKSVCACKKGVGVRMRGRAML